jgi:YqaJ-like viral recombinase domain
VSLHEYPHIEQRSDEWLALRRGMVTASAVGQLITGATLKPAKNDYSRALTAALVAERITGYTDPTYINADMWRGIDDEPRAIGHYSHHYAPVTACGFMVEDKWGFELGYSPDGLVGDDGLVEVKSRRQKKQLQTVLSGEVPGENMAQMQAGLLVSGREWCDYVSYCGGMPLYVKRVLPDPRWFDAISAAVEVFEQTAAEMVAAYAVATTGLPLTERVVELEMSL